MSVASNGAGRCRLPSFVKERSRCVLLLIDVINDMKFEGASELLPRARRMATALQRLKERAARAGIPSVYVNDNFGRWRSDFRSQVHHCLRAEARGRDIVERLAPTKSDYFILKPFNSGFFATALETLLRHLRADTLILTGLTTDNCVLFTAHEAYVRRFRLFIPSDCNAAISVERHRQALELMARNLKADVRPSGKVALARLAAERRSRAAARASGPASILPSADR
jgi:nicotinamidase-related amidase